MIICVGHTHYQHKFTGAYNISMISLNSNKLKRYKKGAD